MLTMRQSDIKNIKKFLSQYRWLVVIVATVVLLSIGMIISLAKPAQRTEANPSAIIKVPTDTCDQNHTIIFSCYKNELTNITRQSGPETATDLIKQQYTKIEYVKSQCHQLMHVVGRAALAKYGNIADTYAHGDQFCW